MVTIACTCSLLQSSIPAILLDKLKLSFFLAAYTIGK